MNPGAITFYLFAGITVAAAAAVVFTRRIIYAGCALLVAFFGVAALYVFLSADFLAATQVLIYVGGVLILILFGVMLTQRAATVRQAVVERVQLLPGLVVSAAVLLLLLAVVFRTSWPIVEPRGFQDTTSRIGTLLMTGYLLPFEVASILLLVALVGAAYTARKEQ